MKINNIVLYFSYIFSTCGFIGYFPFFPGTITSIFAAVIYYFLIPGNFYLFWPILIFLFVLGTLCSWIVSHCRSIKDPSFIVIDEWLAVWLILRFVSKNFYIYLLVVFLFRFFDISKIYPINKVEKIPFGLGIMLDDILAAGMSLACLYILQLIF